MILSGIVVFAFVLIHLYQFKYGPEYLVAQAEPGGEAIRDLYRLEVEVFSNALNVVFYLFCMVVIGGHLWHGIASAFESLGATHPRYTPWVLGAGKMLAFLIAMGFLVIPSPCSSSCARWPPARRGVSAGARSDGGQRAPRARERGGPGGTLSAATAGTRRAR